MAPASASGGPFDVAREETLTSRWLVSLAGLAAVPAAAHAEVYLSAEQARAAMFPGAAFLDSSRTLSDAQVAEIRKLSGERVLNRRLRAWRVSTGGWFVVDQVIGKHEFITYAVGFDAAGAV